MRAPSPKFLRGPSLRKEVFERDHGVCAICGLDTEALEASIREIPCENYARPYWRKVIIVKAGFQKSDDTLWHADHVRAVAEGGGAVGIQGYRTLCAICHRKETALLHRRLSKAAKREEKLNAQRKMRESQ